MLCTVGYTRHPQALLVVPVLPEESVRLLTNGNLRKRAPKEAPAPQEARLQFDKVCHVGLTCAYMCMLANFANTTTQ